MSVERIIITLFAKDQPGILRRVSDTVLTNEGNWLESSLSCLCGQFTGIVHIAVADDNRENLISALESLDKEGIKVTLQDANSVDVDSEIMSAVQILVETSDRPGIIEEISAVLDELKVNVESMDTECESSSMAGYSLFRAHMFLALPESLSEEELEESLGKVSDDVTVSFLVDDDLVVV